MLRKFIILIGLFAIITIASTSTDAAIRRVAARYNVLNIYGGYAEPHGEYSESGLVYFVDSLNRPRYIDADSLYDPTYYLGIDYGTMYGHHFLYLIGFRFTEHNVQKWVFDEVGKYNLRQYDIEFNANYYFLDLLESVWSPYVGAGAQAGFTVYSVKGTVSNDSKLKVAFSANFGFDVKILQTAKKKSFVTISSMNSLNMVATDNRQKYLNLGVGLRYFFR